MSFFNKIPKKIFMGWEGEAPIWAKKSFEKYQELNPDFECKFFTSFDVPESFPLSKYLNEFDYAKFFNADIFRYYILYTYGGIWVDCDTLPFKPIDSFLLKNESFIVKVRPRNKVKILIEKYILDNYIMGCVPKSNFIDEIIRRFKGRLVDGKPKSPYSLAMFRLFRNEEIDNYTNALSTHFTEESDLDDCKIFFSGQRYNLITPFLETSYLKHFRNNDYKLRITK